MDTKITPAALGKISVRTITPLTIFSIAIALLVITLSHIKTPFFGPLLTLVAAIIGGFGVFVFMRCAWDEIKAIIHEDTEKQVLYDRAWHKTKQSYANTFRQVRRFCGKKPDYLRELGSVGRDLTRVNEASGRQSGGHKSRIGGHKKPASSDDDGDGGDGEPPALPLICTTQDLALLLQVSKKTLQNQPKFALPPAFYPPFCRGPRYHRKDVISWINSFQAGNAKRKPKPSPKKIGRPRLASPDQIAAVASKGGAK